MCVLLIAKKEGSLKKASRRVMLAVAVLLIIMVPVGICHMFIGPAFEINVTSSWGTVTLETTEIDTVVKANNPTPLSRSLQRVNVDLYINDLKIASKTYEKATEIGPMQETGVSLTSFLNNSEIPELWSTYIKNGNEFHVKLDGNVTFKTWLREITCPISYNTTVHTDLLELLNEAGSQDFRVGSTALKLKSLGLTWGEVGLNQTEIIASALIFNPNSYSIAIKTLSCAIEMNDIRMGGGIIYRSTDLKPESEETILFEATIDSTMLNEWWNTHLRNDQVTSINFRLDGLAEIFGGRYNFTVDYIQGGASIRILGETIGFGFYLPVL
jgi:LEA14-like dessication related protein